MPESKASKAPLLKPQGEVLVPAASGPFVIKDKFKKGSGVKMSTLFEEFKSRFFGKTENPMPETRLRKYSLLTIAPDGPIIAELGGESKVECPMAAAFSLLKNQGNGEPGILQTTGYANIFYVRDGKGALCAVRIGWASDGWVIDAISVEDPMAWNGKHEIFCPVTA